MRPDAFVVHYKRSIAHILLGSVYNGLARLVLSVPDGGIFEVVARAVGAVSPDGSYDEGIRLTAVAFVRRRCAFPFRRASPLTLNYVSTRAG